LVPPTVPLLSSPSLSWPSEGRCGCVCQCLLRQAENNTTEVEVVRWDACRLAVQAGTRAPLQVEQGHGLRGSGMSARQLRVRETKRQKDEDDSDGFQETQI
jgi:hypothetical protein